jgi:hypothetical protein
MEDENEAEQLLRAVGHRYAGLQTYRDQGRVVRTDSSAGVVEFRTLFARNVGLRFEFTRHGRTEVVAKPIGEPEALMEALAGPTGISGGAAHTIPALLLPEANGENWSLLRLTAVRMVPPPRGQPATGPWRYIAGTGWAGQLLRVAVDPATLLIRRLHDDGAQGIRPCTAQYDPDIIGSVSPEEVFAAGPAGSEA